MASRAAIFAGIVEEQHHTSDMLGILDAGKTTAAGRLLRTAMSCFLAIAAGIHPWPHLPSTPPLTTAVVACRSSSARRPFARQARPGIGAASTTSTTTTAIVAVTAPPVTSITTATHVDVISISVTEAVTVYVMVTVTAA